MTDPSTLDLNAVVAAREARAILSAAFGALEARGLTPYVADGPRVTVLSVDAVHFQAAQGSPAPALPAPKAPGEGRAEKKTRRASTRSKPARQRHVPKAEQLLRGKDRARWYGANSFRKRKGLPRLSEQEYARRQAEGQSTFNDG